jgi:membrane-associated HD superfamily phosphohydrolase
MELRDWINLGYIVIVIVVFVIQNYQIKKQNNLLTYYDKIFNIIKIDEIEKYVQLKEDNVKLELDNKNKTLSNLMENVKELNKDADNILKELNFISNDKDLILKAIELNKDELTSSYNIIFDKLEEVQDFKLKEKINDELCENISKFEKQRNELMKNFKNN